MRFGSLVLLALLTAPAAADDAVVIQTPAPRALCKEMPANDRITPECLMLPPGRFLDEFTWMSLDIRFRELEADKTRLTAENKSLRGTVNKWQPGWGTLLLTLASGAAAGWAAHRYVFDRE